MGRAKTKYGLKYYSLIKNETTTHLILTIAILSVILIGFIAMMFKSTIELNKLLKNSTDEYLEDVSSQLSRDISSNLKKNQRVLEQLADSMPKDFRGEELKEFLKRAEERFGFHSLVIIEKNGTVTPASYRWNELEELRDRCSGEKSVITNTEGHDLVFSAPVYKNGEKEKTLVGVYGEAQVQDFIHPESFGEEGLTCIVDSCGELVVSPEHNKVYRELKAIFPEKKDKLLFQDLIGMQIDANNLQSGVMNFTSVGGKKWALSYEVLNTNDWMLLTFVPADLILNEANYYTWYVYLLIVGLLLLFGLILGSVFQYYKRSRTDLERLAFTDLVTGGMNNVAFQIECKKLISSMPPSTYTIVLLNIKGFKLINENFGIETGNEVLKNVHTLLKDAIYGNEIVARDEADYFFLLLNENNQEKIQARLNRMIKEINYSYTDTESHYILIMRQGACLIDEPDLDVRTLQDHARVASEARGSEEKCNYYHFTLMEKMIKEQTINSLFDRSIENHDFHVYLQPKVRLSDGAIGGTEALVRWIHPEKGIIYPNDFIPLLERNGNICILDRYVFEQVCIWMEKRMELGEPLFPVSVNLSRVHFKNVNFLDAYAQIKEQYHIPDGLIELEITESIFFDKQQINFVKEIIEKMRSYGFLCSLDDFGIGFSSLSLLREFDVDTIKLDRQFFGDIESKRSQCVISSLIGLSKELGMKVVAEGIEVEDQVEYLRQANCDMVQGYFFSKPLPIEEFEKWSKAFMGGRN